MTFTPDPESPPPRLSWWRRVTPRLPRWRGAAPATPRRRGLTRWVVIPVLLLLVLYYPIGMVWVHTIDDNPDFAAAKTPDGASRAVAITAALVHREVDEHHWTPMDPFFLPGGALDNMPNFQRGMITALGRFATELMDQVGRTRGTSQVDRDLELARGYLNEQPNQWTWSPTVSLLPTTTSAQRYRAGRERLLAYNQRLALGQAVFERRSDSLQALIDRMANDIGSDSAVIDQHIHEHGGDLLDFQADDIFYFNKGRLYANYMLLRELQYDFQGLLKERELTRAWEQMLATFRIAATLQPWIVFNGSPDLQFLPSHLAGQGFYLLRARIQLREIRDILQK